MKEKLPYFTNISLRLHFAGLVYYLKGPLLFRYPPSMAVSGKFSAMLGLVKLKDVEMVATRMF